MFKDISTILHPRFTLLIPPQNPVLYSPRGILGICRLNSFQLAETLDKAKGMRNKYTIANRGDQCAWQLIGESIMVVATRLLEGRKRKF